MTRPTPSEGYDGHRDSIRPRGPHSSLSSLRLGALGPAPSLRAWGPLMPMRMCMASHQHQPLSSESGVP